MYKFNIYHIEFGYVCISMILSALLQTYIFSLSKCLHVILHVCCYYCTFVSAGTFVCMCSIVLLIVGTCSCSMFTCACRCRCAHIQVEARGWHQVLSLFIAHLVFWTWRITGSAMLPGYQAPGIYLSSSDAIPCPAFHVNVRDLNSHPQISQASTLSTDSSISSAPRAFDTVYP